jgi:hypothetical protein
MKRRLTVFIFCACLCLTLLTGCGGSKIATYSGDDSGATSTPADSGKGLAAYDADTVVCSVNGSDITWEEYYYFLNTYRNAAQSSYGDITDWTAASAFNPDETNNAAILNLAQPEMLRSHLLLSEADEQKLSVSDDAVAKQIASSVDTSSFGNNDGTCSDDEEQAFDNYLTQNSLSRALFSTIVKESMTYDALYSNFTTGITDEDVLSWAADQGYMAAKHILFLTVDKANYNSESGTYASLSDDEIAAAKAKADDVYAQLQAVENDPDALLTLFNELMNEDSEDTALKSFPDGYCFKAGGTSQAAFEAAAASLDENYGLSGVTQTDLGYDIILRVPLDPSMTMGYNSSSGTSSGTAYSLRDYCLSQKFGDQIEQWYTAAQINWNDSFDTLDLSTVF